MKPIERRKGLRQRQTERADRHATVLYVEDDPENWAIAELNLGRSFKLAWAKNDADACDFVRRNSAELSAILMDIELRGSQLSGIELSELFRGRRLARDVPGYASDLPKLRQPILFVTAHLARYSEAELLNAGGNKLIPKPVNFGELSHALETLVSE
jgi:CheY-like chemotaxis protein